MKVSTLLIAQLLCVIFGVSSAAFAKDMDILCMPNIGGVYANTFSGNGSISFVDEGSHDPQTANAKLTVALETGDKKRILVNDFEGTLEILKAGEFMVNTAYSVDLLSKDKKVSLKMFLNGPKEQSTARVYYKGIEFRSSCDSVH